MRVMVQGLGQPLHVVISGRREDRPDTLSALTDEALMTRFGNGDPDAFEALYRRHRGRLHRFVQRMTPGDADEVFQEVWMAVVAGKERYVPSARFITYLFTIAHYRAAARWRARGRAFFDQLPEDDDLLSDEQPDPLGLALNAELGRALNEAIAGLPPAQREAFLMQAEGGLSLDEIAEASDTCRETVKSRLRYANRRLRRALESWK